ncbi:MAG: TetR/AcrR family transcriptional regulator, partial [Streptosporangiaceae bacterium]
LRDHVEVAWTVMSENRPVMIALFESALAAGPASGALWDRLAGDTEMFRRHLEYLRESGHRLPGDPALVAAAMGGMMSMLAYALIPADTRYSAAEVVETLSKLLLYGLAGPSALQPAGDAGG